MSRQIAANRFPLPLYIYWRIVMEEQVLEFIKRRFPNDSHWMDGNCFYFAQMLKARFHGDVVYDPIDGHFLFLASDNELYDWTGRRSYTKEERNKMVLWSNYSRKDPLDYEHIVRDCIK
jgi:hypothetical protein